MSLKFDFNQAPKIKLLAHIIELKKIFVNLFDL